MNVKRTAEIAFAAAGLALTAPVLGAIAVAIVVTDGPPVFFRQERVGLNGSRFRIHKFRTMTVDHGGPTVSAAGDSRITGVGRCLRKSKLDELPQLIDVVVGSMSIVGPRPEVPEYVEKWPTGTAPMILSVRPGITDPASVKYRNEAELLAQADDAAAYYENVLLPAKAQMYVDYVRDRSFVGDMKIVGQTLVAVLRG